MSVSKTGFSSLNRLTKSLAIVLSIEITIALITLVLDAYESHLLTSLLTGEYDYLTGLALIESNLIWQSSTAIIGISFGIFALILFLYWFYRAYRNLPALGASGLKYTPIWVVAYFFIPILSLWRPYKALTEIWRASDPVSVSINGNSWRTLKSSYILLIWWILSIMVIVTAISFAISFPFAETFEDFIGLNIIDIIIQTLTIVTNTLFIYIAKQICDRQEASSYLIAGIA